MDYGAYLAFVNNAVERERHAEGFLELRAHRSIVGSRQVRVTHVWKSLADWAKFVDSAENRALDAELRSFVENVEMQIWGPSPVMPEPVRPSE